MAKFNNDGLRNASISLDTNPYFISSVPHKGFPRIFYERKFCKKFCIKFSEFQANIAAGLKYCTGHKQWEPKENFYESDRHSYACKEWIREKRRLYYAKNILKGVKP